LRTKATAALFILIIIAGSIPIALGERGSRYLYVSTYTLESRGEDGYHLTEDDATIPLFVNNSGQTVRLWNTTHSVAREFVDDDGNRLAVLDLPQDVPPHANFTFSVTYQIETVDQPGPEIDVTDAGPTSAIPPEIVEEFCAETETFTTGDEAIQALARRLAANETTVLGAVSGLLDWLVANVSYSSFEVPRYPNETLAEGRGDCDDQAILLVTMCRALGIPALLQVGVVFSEGIEGERSSWGGHLRIEQRGVGWHGWALVYIPPWGWLPIDMTLQESREPLSMIMEAPEYRGYIVTCLNISKQEYIGDSLRSRELLMSSDLYITASDAMIKRSQDRVWTMRYAVFALSMGAVAVIVIVFLSRRRSEIGFKGAHRDWTMGVVADAHP